MSDSPIGVAGPPEQAGSSLGQGHTEDPRIEAAGRCPVHIDVDLADEEPPNDALTPHAFGCNLAARHKGPHEATVSWYGPEED